MEDGASSIGASGAGKCVARGNVLGNLPGDLGDITRVLMDELLNGTSARDTPAASHFLSSAARAGLKDDASVRQWALATAAKLHGHHCSMIGAWGPRTEGGRVLTGRNLDWESRTGVDEHKLVTVYHPPEGGHPHATVGFAAIQGALTGMSAAGLTVHEANLEEAQETFRGFPWLLRLRWLMEHADDLASAKAIWEATNNTVGFNHGVGSAKDGEFMVMETEAWYTAYFRANDPREASATDPKSGKKIGAPMPHALWRTNHGYDPKTQADFLWSQSPTSNTVYRYMLIHQTLMDYEAAGVAMTPASMVNTTAIVGQKGGQDWTSCDGDYDKGTNVLSVAFDPANLELYAAWESGPKDDWAPAACSDYIHLDMKPFFQQ